MTEEHFCVNNLDEFLEQLRDYEIRTATKYIVLQSCSSFSKEKALPKVTHKVYWENGVPYLKLGKKIYACHQGEDNNLSQKNKYKKQKELKACSDHSFIKQYKRTKVTKKLGCPVKIIITRALKLPKFKILGSECTHYRKTQISKKIREEIAQLQLEGEECYFFNLPKPNDHKFHLLGENAAVSKPIDDRDTGLPVASNIQEVYNVREPSDEEERPDKCPEKNVATKENWTEMSFYRTLHCALSKEGEEFVANLKTLMEIHKDVSVPLLAGLLITAQSLEETLQLINKIKSVHFKKKCNYSHNKMTRDKNVSFSRKINNKRSGTTNCHTPKKIKINESVEEIIRAEAEETGNEICVVSEYADHVLEEQTNNIILDIQYNIPFDSKEKSF